MKIEFEFIDIGKIKIDYKFIERLALIIFEEEKKKISRIVIIFCSNKYIKVINNNFLKHNYFTDVITFSEISKNGVNGNVFINLDCVKVNAKKFSKGVFKSELYRVIIHAFLHIVGYNDLSVKQKSAMTSKENYYLKKLSLQF